MRMRRANSDFTSEDRESAEKNGGEKQNLTPSQRSQGLSLSAEFTFGAEAAIPQVITSRTDVDQVADGFGRSG